MVPQEEDEQVRCERVRSERLADSPSAVSFYSAHMRSLQRVRLSFSHTVYALYKRINNVGTVGMYSKVQAAKTIQSSGVVTCVFDGCSSRGAWAGPCLRLPPRRKAPETLAAPDFLPSSPSCDWKNQACDICPPWSTSTMVAHLMWPQ